MDLKPSTMLRPYQVIFLFGKYIELLASTSNPVAIFVGFWIYDRIQNYCSI